MRRRAAVVLLGTLLVASAAFASARLRPGAAPSPYAEGETSVSFLAGGASVVVDAPSDAELARMLEEAGGRGNELPADRYLVIRVVARWPEGGTFDLGGAWLDASGEGLRPLAASSFRLQDRTAPWAIRLFGNGPIGAPRLLVFRRPLDGPVTLKGVRLEIGKISRGLEFPFVPAD